MTTSSAEVCAGHIEITDSSITRMQRLADRTYDPLVWLGKRMCRWAD